MEKAEGAASPGRWGPSSSALLKTDLQLGQEIVSSAQHQKEETSLPLASTTQPGFSTPFQEEAQPGPNRPRGAGSGGGFRKPLIDRFNEAVRITLIRRKASPGRCPLIASSTRSRNVASGQGLLLWGRSKSEQGFPELHKHLFHRRGARRGWGEQSTSGGVLRLMDGAPGTGWGRPPPPLFPSHSRSLAGGPRIARGAQGWLIRLAEPPGAAPERPSRALTRRGGCSPSRALEAAGSGLRSANPSRG